MSRTNPFKILLAIDGSEHSKAAANLVHKLPWPANSEMAVLAVAPQRWPTVAHSASLPQVLEATAREAQQIELESAERIAAQVARDLFDDGHAAVYHMRCGRAPEVILQYAGEIAADVIVVGARGLSAPDDVHLGSTSQELVNTSKYPLLVVRPQSQPLVLSTLLAVDGSPEANHALGLVGRMAWPHWAQVTVAGVAETEAALPTGRPNEVTALPAAIRRTLLDGAEANVRAATVCLAGCGAEIKSSVRLGRPAVEILAAAAEVDAELIVLGARGHTRATPVRLGGVAQRIVRYAPCSVLIVR
jgi:nucleotide-binding universal stress UspA family protein